MKNIKEISRRCRYHEEAGFACGPICFEAVDAGITVEVDGQIVYLLGQWESETSGYGFEATKESIYDIIDKDYEFGSDEARETYDALDRIRKDCIEDEEFKPFYKALKKMIRDERKAHA